MKKQNEKDIVDEFKQLEGELISLLVEPFELDDVENNSDVKKHLKKYILRVKKAKEVFEKYEMTAKQIELALDDGEDSSKLSHSVVDLRENKDQKVMPTLEEFEKLAEEASKKNEEPEYEDEMVDAGGAPVLIRKRKIKSQSTKEM